MQARLAKVSAVILTKKTILEYVKLHDGYIYHVTMELTKNFIITCRYKALRLEEKGKRWQLFFKIFCFLNPSEVATDSVEGLFLFEQVSAMTSIYIWSKVSCLKIETKMAKIDVQCHFLSIAFVCVVDSSISAILSLLFFINRINGWSSYSKIYLHSLPGKYG